ncbi:hypothetical protein IWX90DRAFT_69173 [Phyllosticta citrichinensis]|uniref:Uncharacterized protein n=1 Tax=Phyllosticta citrichinensis TaxID=1130410 RepID=A0ABR1XGA5_9PEZI
MAANNTHRRHIRKAFGPTSKPRGRQKLAQYITQTELSLRKLGHSLAMVIQGDSQRHADAKQKFGPHLQKRHWICHDLGHSLLSIGSWIFSHFSLATQLFGNLGLLFALRVDPREPVHTVRKHHRLTDTQGSASDWLQPRHGTGSDSDTPQLLDFGFQSFLRLLFSILASRFSLLLSHLRLTSKLLEKRTQFDEHRSRLNMPLQQQRHQSSDAYDASHPRILDFSHFCIFSAATFVCIHSCPRAQRRSPKAFSTSPYFSAAMLPTSIALCR